MRPEVFLPEDYRPAEDEPFMNERQLEYFRRKLIVWRQELLSQSAETIDNLQTPPRKPTARWNCAPATANASWSTRSTRRCAGSTKTNMAIAK
jgi:RNA polymerase-binding transcription factor DksA